MVFGCLVDATRCARRALLFVAIGPFGPAVLGQVPHAPAVVPAETITKAWLGPPFQTAKVSRGNSEVRALIDSDPATKARLSSTLSAAGRLVSRNPVVALLLLERDGSVLFEKYQQGAGPEDLILGYSMTKSLTSVAMGQALCEGLVASVADPAERYADVLKGTAFGSASIEQLLTMASAAKRSIPGAGQPVQGWTSDLLRHHTVDVRSGFKRFGTGGPDASALGEFEYKGMDSQAIGAVIAGATKQPVPDYASAKVWQQIGAEADARWLVDRNGDASTAEGFGARVRDWGRLALYVRDEMASSRNTCFAEYLKKATTMQIKNTSNHARAFGGYGYQFWTDNWRAKGVYWMEGYGGQMVATDRRSGRVMVMFSTTDAVVSEAESFMARWSGEEP